MVIQDLDEFIPQGTTEIVSGGAKGIDECAKAYAKDAGLKYTEFLPEYNLHSRRAPIERNKLIVQYSDTVVAFWDGKSRGTQFVIKYAKKMGKPIYIYPVKQALSLNI